MFNTRSALNAIERFDAMNPDDPESHRAILNCLQEIVSYTAAISKFFWPQDEKKCKWRGDQLKKAFQIEDDSPLGPRTLRNSLEHLDERLDKFFKTEFAGYIYPEFVGTSGGDDGVATCFFRAYFSDTGEYRILNDVFDVSAVRDAIADLNDKLERADANGGCLPDPQGK